MTNANKAVAATVVVLILAAAVWYAYMRPAQPSTAETQTPPTESSAGKHCGGNIANAPTCDAGYHCAAVSGSTLPFGDVGGVCVAD